MASILGKFLILPLDADAAKCSAEHSNQRENKYSTARQHIEGKIIVAKSLLANNHYR